MNQTSKPTLSFLTGAAIVVASMVGSGIFGTTGPMAADVTSGGAILVVWILGGVIALGAALAFAELGTMFPGSGGEVDYLHRIFGPFPGFVAGVVTLVAGFAAPLGGVASLLSQYTEALQLSLPGDARLVGTVALLALASLHGIGVRLGARVNNAFCIFKIVLMLGYIVSGLLAEPTAGAVAMTQEPVSAAGIGKALVMVAFAYTGWNAAAYLAEELEDRDRALPRALYLGTGLVVLLYVGMNVVYLRAGTPAEMAGQPAVGEFAARRLFGDHVARWFTLGIVMILLSTLSSFLMAGTRVAWALGARGQLPAWLVARNSAGGSLAAALTLSAVGIGFLWMGTFWEILGYVGLLLTLSTATAVLGLMVLRHRSPAQARPFRVPLYPWSCIAFLLLSTWMVYSTLAAPEGLKLALVGTATTLLASAAVWPIVRKHSS